MMSKMIVIFFSEKSAATRVRIRNCVLQPSKIQLLSRWMTMHTHVTIRSIDLTLKQEQGSNFRQLRDDISV